MTLAILPNAGWVGWRNDSRNGQPVDIIFEFDSVRDFTSLSIYANNQFTKDVQVNSRQFILVSLELSNKVGCLPVSDIF